MFHYGTNNSVTPTYAHAQLPPPPPPNHCIHFVHFNLCNVWYLDYAPN